MKSSIGYFEFEYKNGFKQIKELISTSDFKEYQKLRNQKTEIENKVKGKKKDPDLEIVLKSINEELKQFSFPFIVENSPMWGAIQTGVIELPESQGGKHPVNVNVVNMLIDYNIIEE